MQHLREQPGPQHLEAEAERAASGRHQAEPYRRERRQPGGDVHRRRDAGVTHRERDQAGERARARDREIARRDPDPGRQAESHGRDADGATERVEGIEQPAPLADAGRRERVAEDGERRAEAERRRKEGERHGGDPRREPGRPERLLRAVGGQRPEDRDRPERAGRSAELEEGVARDRSPRSASRQGRAGPEPSEVDRQYRRGGRRGRAEDEAGRAHPEELEPERGSARDGEARPEKPAHGARNLAAPWRIMLAVPTTMSMRLASATSAGPSGRSMR